VWDRPADALPDADDWPTWGALRERILVNATEICITHTPSLVDAFPEEVVTLSPPGLTKMEFRGSKKLTKFVCSPTTSCVSLQRLDLSRCASLRFVLLQSDSLLVVNLSKCVSLEKALVQVKNLTSVTLDGCVGVKTLMIWSDTLAELDLSACENLQKLELRCPALEQDGIKMPESTSKVDTPKTEVEFLPVARLVLENMNARAEMNRKRTTG